MDETSWLLCCYAFLFCRIQVRNVGGVISCERGRRSVRVWRHTRLSVCCSLGGSKETSLDKSLMFFCGKPSVYRRVFNIFSAMAS